MLADGAIHGFPRSAPLLRTDESPAVRLVYFVLTLLAVTVLTSWDPARFRAELAITEPLPRHGARLAGLAAGACIGGCVCSPLEVASLRAAHPLPFALVTPGIRPAGAALNDQKRVLTPAQAIAAGASQLVIGRPITAAADPAAAFAACCAELES